MVTSDQEARQVSGAAGGVSGVDMCINDERGFPQICHFLINLNRPLAVATFMSAVQVMVRPMD